MQFKSDNELLHHTHTHQEVYNQKMYNSYTEKFSYNVGGIVKMLKLQVEYRNKGMRGGWITRSILKNDPMENNDWLDVLRNLYADQEATVRTRHRTGFFQI